MHTMVTRQYLSWRRLWSTRNIGLAAGEMPKDPPSEMPKDPPSAPLAHTGLIQQPANRPSMLVLIDDPAPT